jgi:hypothetical protein
MPSVCPAEHTQRVSQISVEGTVTDFQCANRPTLIVYLDLKDDSVQKWSTETRGGERTALAGWTRKEFSQRDMLYDQSMARSFPPNQEEMKPAWMADLNLLAKSSPRQKK